MYNAKPLWKTDVIVVGSGSSGATAAITAAQQGLSVALIERYGFMGGISTQVLDTFYGFYTPGSAARKVVGGVPDQVVESLMTRGKALLRPNTYGAGQGITYDPETLKIVWERLATQAGVKILYHSFVVDVTQDAERVTGVIAVSKNGFMSLQADVIIDASGDADVAVKAGAPYDGADNGAVVQALTTTFHLINVDMERAQAVKKDQLHTLMAKASASGDYDLPRREGSIHITPFEGVMATNMTRVGNIDATDPVALTSAEIEGRRQAEEYARFLIDKVPGYERAEMTHLSHQIGVRESRRIHGEYRLTKADVLAARDFDDAIARCGAPIEDHHAGNDTKWEYLPDGATYGIPYRCLVPQRVDGVLVVGRCLSAEHDAHASVRSMGQCMAMGQAAGVAARVALDNKLSPREVDTDMLRNRLRETGAILE
ncbi:MAG: FAD-dependent oxidoreductase [Anaerolineales bacterium]